MTQQKNNPELPAEAPTHKPEIVPEKPDPTIVPPPLESVNYAEKDDGGCTIDLDTNTDVRSVVN